MKTKSLLLSAMLGLLAGCASSDRGGMGNDNSTDSGYHSSNPPGNGQPTPFNRPPVAPGDTEHAPSDYDRSN